jgi:hypothetical protein
LIVFALAGDSTMTTFIQRPKVYREQENTSAAPRGGGNMVRSASLVKSPP